MGDAMRFQRSGRVQSDRQLRRRRYVRDGENLQRAVPSDRPGETESLPNG